MRLVHYIAILAGVAAFAAIMLIAPSGWNNYLVISVAFAVSLHAGWIVYSPRTVAKTYAKTATDLLVLFFGETKINYGRTDRCVGLSWLGQAIVILGTPIAMGFWFYHRTEVGFNLDFGANALASGFVSMVFEQNSYDYYGFQILLDGLIVMLAICVLWLPSIMSDDTPYEVQSRTSLERVIFILKVLAVAVPVTIFNQVLVVVGCGVVMFILALTMICIAAYILYVMLKLAANQRLISVTVGIGVGDAVLLYFLGINGDRHEMALAFCAGTVSGWIAGELVHQLGRLTVAMTVEQESS